MPQRTTRRIINVPAKRCSASKGARGAKVRHRINKSGREGKYKRRRGRSGTLSQRTRRPINVPAKRCKASKGARGAKTEHRTTGGEKSESTVVLAGDPTADEGRGNVLASEPTADKGREIFLASEPTADEGREFFLASEPTAEMRAREKIWSKEAENRMQQKKARRTARGRA